MTAPARGISREFIGLSASGSKHGLLVQTFPRTGIKFTLTNPETRKKHGSVMLDVAQLLEMIEWLSTGRDNEDG